MDKQAKRKSFVFYSEWQEVLMEYPAEVRLEVYDAIIGYAVSGTLSELKPLAKMAFSFIKRQIDLNNSKYDDISEKRSNAGKKGMAKRYNKEQSDEQPAEQESTATDNKPNKCYQPITNLSTDNKSNYNEHDNEYEYDNKETPPDGGAKKDKLSLNLSKRRDAFVNTLRPYVEFYGKDMVNEFFSYWSEPNKSGTKMRFELEKTWDVSRRLSRWANNNFRNKGKAKDDAATSARRESVSVYDSQQQEEREREREESQKNAVTWEEACIAKYGKVKPLGFSADCEQHNN